MGGIGRDTPEHAGIGQPAYIAAEEPALRGPAGDRPRNSIRPMDRLCASSVGFWAGSVSRGDLAATRWVARGPVSAARKSVPLRGRKGHRRASSARVWELKRATSRLASTRRSTRNRPGNWLHAHTSIRGKHAYISQRMLAEARKTPR